MLKTLGIETRLQLAITICVVALVFVSPLGGSGGAPPVFFTYRTLLLVITVLCTIGSLRQDFRISPVFLSLIAVNIVLALISVLRIPGSHFSGMYLWYRHTFFISAFLALALYSRYQSARWRGTLLGTVVFVNLIHLVPDLLLNRRPVAGFSTNNANYFATFMLIGMAASLAVVIFGTKPAWRIAAAVSGSLLLFGIIQTASRGATLAAVLVAVVAAIRSGNRVPRRVWMFAGLAALVGIVATSPYLVGKFLDRGEIDPYNYARTQVWMSSLRIIAEKPLLGSGFGEYYNVSKRFAFPVEGLVARYLKRAQIAHSEYLQYAAETGVPATVLLLSLLGYLIYLAWKRAENSGAEYRCFHEAAIFTAVGIGTHALVDNCWTIPVTASGLVVLSLADFLPLRQRSRAALWTTPRVAFAGVGLAALYLYSTVIPALGLYYNDTGHQAFDRANFNEAERYHLKAVAIVPDHPLFLDNLGMVYLQQYADTKDKTMLSLAGYYFAQAIARGPRILDPHIHMETVLIRSLTWNREQDQETCKRLIENNTRLLAIDPFIPFARKNMADAFYQLGQPERAFQELRKAIEYEPNYVPGYLQFGVWYNQLGNKNESDRYTSQAVQIVNKYREFHPREPYEGILLARPEGSWLKK
ncbi:MAG: hypothetical protein DMG13_08750 [Acidobacteria bacterium]|nr:MAG: hypothetical protein DMG13_08750 [Acidobacteriota bacterium]